MNEKTIKVTVKFFATLREFGPEKEALVIPENSEINLLFVQSSLMRKKIYPS